MKKKVEKPYTPAPESDHKETKGIVGYPTSQDNYGNGPKEEFIDMEEGFQSHAAYDNNKTSSPNEQEYNEEVFGDDLEIPYSELDD